MFFLLFLSLNPAMHAISLFAFQTTILFFVSIRIIKSIFETWVYLGFLYSTMFSLMFLSFNPAMHAISLFAFVSIRIIKIVFKTWVYLGLLDSVFIIEPCNACNIAFAFETTMILFFASIRRTRTCLSLKDARMNLLPGSVF